MISNEYAGSCHCGAIGYRYTATVNPAQWSIRACQCEFCRKHDALSTSDPDGQLQFVADDAGQLQRYRFALRTADFLLCSNCGVYIGAIIDSDSSRFGIINTRALLRPTGYFAAVTPMTYDDEDKDARTRRREQRWTPVSALPW